VVADIDASSDQGPISDALQFRLSVSPQDIRILLKEFGFSPTGDKFKFKRAFVLLFFGVAVAK
jgi:hypothetical protein